MDDLIGAAISRISTMRMGCSVHPLWRRIRAKRRDPPSSSCTWIHYAAVHWTSAPLWFGAPGFCRLAGKHWLVIERTTYRSPTDVDGYDW